MKVVPKSLNTFLKAPITFWKPEEEQEILTTGQSHADATIHEVKYNPSEKKSGTYKVYITPFAFGDAEQWLQFKSKLDLVINGQGLLEDGPARFNLTRSLLKGEALRVFNDKALELKSETKKHHIKCLQAVTEHVFPEQALQTQKRYMRRSVFLHSKDRPIREFRARFIETNNYLTEFPPFGPNQEFKEDEIKEIVHNILPKHWQSLLKREGFDLDRRSLADLFDHIKRYQVAEQIDSPTKSQDTKQSNDSKNTQDKSKDKKRKNKSTNKESDSPPPKRFCILHQVDTASLDQRLYCHEGASQTNACRLQQP